MALTIKTFNSEEFCGYKQITTFFQDFSIADNFGFRAIKDTYKRAFKQWKNNYKYVTELCMVLNWKSWEHANDVDNNICCLYSDLYYEVRDWCFEHLKGDKLAYFIETTD